MPKLKNPTYTDGVLGGTVVADDGTESPLPEGVVLEGFQTLNTCYALGDGPLDGVIIIQVHCFGPYGRRDVCAHGSVFGHPCFPDGTEVSTSAIEQFFTTMGPFDMWFF